MTLIEISPHKRGRRVFEPPGVAPVFPQKEQAIAYAYERARYRSGEIRVPDSSGSVERVIAFDESHRRL